MPATSILHDYTAPRLHDNIAEQKFQNLQSYNIVAETGEKADFKKSVFGLEISVLTYALGVERKNISSKADELFCLPGNRDLQQLESEKGSLID